MRVSLGAEVDGQPRGLLDGPALLRRVRRSRAGRDPGYDWCRPRASAGGHRSRASDAVPRPTCAGSASRRSRPRRNWNEWGLLHFLAAEGFEPAPRVFLEGPYLGTDAACASSTSIRTSSRGRSSRRCSQQAPSEGSRPRIDSMPARGARRASRSRTSFRSPTTPRRWIAGLDDAGVEHLATFASLPEEVPAVGRGRARSRAAACRASRWSTRARGIPRTDLRDLLDGRCVQGRPALPGDAPLRHRRAMRASVCCTYWKSAAPPCSSTAVCSSSSSATCSACRAPFDLAYANPLSVIPAANRFRGVNFVIPHFGAGFFREALMAGAQCQNVFVDTSSSNSWIRTQPGPRRARTRSSRARWTSSVPTASSSGPTPTCSPRDGGATASRSSSAALTAAGADETVAQDAGLRRQRRTPAAPARTPAKPSVPVPRFRTCG